MKRHFDVGLQELKEHLIRMAGLVERAIEVATEGMHSENKSRFQELYEIESRINQAHLDVDDLCIKLLALQQPFAKDLRMIEAILKISTDLERMGDQAVNIAHNAEHYIDQPPLKPLVDLPKMFDEARFMVREAIDSFVRQDQSLARDVLKRDDRVDALKGKIFKDVLEHMKHKPDMVEQGLCLILIARNLERIGDHSTNIAEDVIFAVSGEDVRHASRAESLKEALK